MTRPSSQRFCGYCGCALAARREARAGAEGLVCTTCEAGARSAAHGVGPALLVLTTIFAEDKVLLLKRGLPPYLGKWAPPGGFVEAGESLEAAAVRETQEEVGIQLDQEQLLPHAVMSQPSLNQVYVSFLARLEQPVAPRPVLPEALAARWFSEADYPAGEIWGPAVGLDIGQIYQRLRHVDFHFYQRTDSSMRVIASDGRSTYFWRRSC